MRIVRHLSSFPYDLRGGAVVVGNFDGVHRGHQALILRCIEESIELNGAAIALTFEPHPRQIFAPDSLPFRLTPFRSKAKLMRHFGVDVLAALRFSRTLYEKSASDFVRQILVDGLGARHLVVGYDFVFGKRRGGDVRLLRTMGIECGFEVTVLDPVAHGDDVYSSTIIRMNIQTGRVRRAADLLGHWWEIQGKIRLGDRRGRDLGFPTANLMLPYIALRPALGVYAVYLGLDVKGKQKWYPGVANIGFRPTFGGKSITLEVHLFDFDDDIYGRNARVAFVEFLRPEMKFEGIDQIKSKIRSDCLKAQEVLATGSNQISEFHEVSV